MDEVKEYAQKLQKNKPEYIEPETRKRLYGLYKQAEEGNNNENKPSQKAKQYEKWMW